MITYNAIHIAYIYTQHTCIYMCIQGGSIKSVPPKRIEILLLTLEDLQGDRFYNYN